MAVNFTWYEPLAVKRDRLAKTDPWYPNRVKIAVKTGVGAALAYAVFDAVVKSSGRSGSANYWLGMLFVAVAAGTLYGLLRPWLASFVESPIIVSQQGINRNSILPMRAEFCPWESIGELVVERWPARNGAFRALVAYDPCGKVLATFGVAPETTVAQIAAAVSQFRSVVRVVDRT